MHTQSSVEARYADAAHQAEAALCCPVDYDPQYLKVIPQEVIEKITVAAIPRNGSKMAKPF